MTKPEEAAALFDKGASLDQIGRTMRIGHDCVRQYLIKTGRIKPKATILPVKERAERGAAIYAARQSGETYKKIAGRWGISPALARTLCIAWEWREKRRAEGRAPPAGMPSRAWYALRNGYELRGSDITPERVATFTYDQLVELPNVGAFTIAQVRTWLRTHGLDLVQPEPSPRLVPTVTLEKYAAYLRKHGWTVLPPE